MSNTQHNMDDVFVSVDPFERFATTYFADPGKAYKTIKRLRARRSEMMTNIETPKTKGKKATSAVGGAPKKTRATKEPSLDKLKKALGKISTAQLLMLQKAVTEQSKK